MPPAGGLLPPPEVISSWPAPNYENPTTRSWIAPILVIIIFALTFLVFSARLWARIRVSKNPGLDDLLMMIAMVPLLGLTMAVCLAITKYGFQWHVWEQTTETLITTRQITLAIEVLYLVATCLIKISILCFYRRITNGSITKTFVYWVWGSIVFVAVYGAVFILLIVFTCDPIRGYWHMFDLMWRLQNELKCHNEGAEIVAVVVISTLQDLVICALPILLVWNLQIPRRQKFGLIGIFAAGLLTCVCGIMRTYYAIYVYYFTYDITWYAFYGWIWTAVEAYLGMMCACAPALKVFFRRYFNLSSKGSSKRSGDSYDPNHPATIGSANIPNCHTRGAPSQDIATPIPLDRIKVSNVMDVTIEDNDGIRDDLSLSPSDASTKELTALPTTLPGDRSGSAVSRWTHSCRTLCENVPNHSRSSSRNQDKMSRASVDQRRS